MRTGQVVHFLWLHSWLWHRAWKVSQAPSRLVPDEYSPQEPAQCANACVSRGWACTAVCSQKACAQPRPASGEFKFERLWAQPAPLWHKPVAQVDSIRGLQGIKMWYIIRASRLFFIVVSKHSFINLMKLASHFCWTLPRSLSLTLERIVSQSLEWVKFSVLPSQNFTCNYLECLLKYRFLGGTPRDPDSAGLGWMLRVCIP